MFLCPGNFMGVRGLFISQRLHSRRLWRLWILRIPFGQKRSCSMDDAQLVINASMYEGRRSSHARNRAGDGFTSRDIFLSFGFVHWRLPGWLMGYLKLSPIFSFGSAMLIQGLISYALFILFFFTWYLSHLSPLAHHRPFRADSCSKFYLSYYFIHIQENCEKNR